MVELVRDADRVAGLIINTRPAGRLEVHADFVVGADGRHSTLRELVAIHRADAQWTSSSSSAVRPDSG